MCSAPCRGWFSSLPGARGCDWVPVRGVAAAHAHELTPEPPEHRQPRSRLPPLLHRKTSPGPGHGQHVALTQQLSWPGNSPREMALDGCTDLYPSSTLPQHQQCKERCCWLVPAPPACLHCRGTTAPPLPPSPAVQSLPAAPAAALTPPAHGAPSAWTCRRGKLIPSWGEGN